MVGAEVSAGGPAQLSISGQCRVLVVLCVTQIVSWGVLYYAFPVLAPSIAADTGWSIAAVTAAFSAGLVVSALVGIPAGRWLDRFGPRPVMTAASVLAVPAVLVIGTARSFPVFVAGWLLAGVAMAGTLYPPAFAALTRWWGQRRVTALTALTLLAGLSSTVFAPLTATLLEHLGWQHSYLVLAGVLAAITIPAHYVGLRGPWPKPEPAADHPAHAEQAPDAIARSRAFLLLAAAIALGTFAAFAVVVNQVPLLLERGLSTQLAAGRSGSAGLGRSWAGWATPVSPPPPAFGSAAWSFWRSPRSRPPCSVRCLARRPAHRRGHARRRRPRRVHPASGHRYQ